MLAPFMLIYLQFAVIPESCTFSGRNVAVECRGLLLSTLVLDRSHISQQKIRRRKTWLIVFNVVVVVTKLQEAFGRLWTGQCLTLRTQSAWLWFNSVLKEIFSNSQVCWRNPSTVFFCSLFTSVLSFRNVSNALIRTLGKKPLPHRNDGGISFKEFRSLGVKYTSQYMVSQQVRHCQLVDVVQYR